MLCPQCGRANVTEARFCASCGVEMDSARRAQPAGLPAQRPLPSRPPPPGSSQRPPAQQSWRQPPAQQGWQQPSAQQSWQQPTEPSWQQYYSPYAMPDPQNTSGAGPQAIAPLEAQGWTFAGCVPFGLFGFFNGMVGWGLVGLSGAVIPYIGCITVPLYFFNIGLNGKRLAWQSRRFESVEQYRRTMSDWSVWGTALFVIDLVLLLIMLCAVVSSIMEASA